MEVLDLKNSVAAPEKFACPICGTAMEERDKVALGEPIKVMVLMCNCLANKATRAAIEQLYRSANMPKKFYGEGMTDWVDAAGTEDLKRVAEEYLKDLESNIRKGIGMLVGGPIGTGKTKRILHVMNGAIKKGVPSYYISSNELNTQIPRLKKSGKGLDAFMDKLIKTKLLVYDDFGESDPNSWDLKDANLVVNERYNHGRAILFTTMKSIPNLADQVGDHMISRMIEMSGPFIAEVEPEAIDMRMPDNRKAHGLKVLF